MMGSIQVTFGHHKDLSEVIKRYRPIIRPAIEEFLQY